MPKYFLHPKGKLGIHWWSLPIFPPAPGNHESTFFLYGLACSGRFISWSQCVLFHGCLLSHSTTCSRSIQVGASEHGFCGRVVAHSMERARSVYPLTRWCSFELVPFSSSCDVWLWAFVCPIFFGRVFSSLGHPPRSGLLGHMVTVFSSLRKFHTVLHSS